MRAAALSAVAGVLALSLAGCGGGGDVRFTGDTPTTPTTPVTPPVTLVDTFYTAVLNLIGDGAETTTEPVATDTVVATAPEDTEPVVLK